MSFAFHGFSQDCLEGEAAWASGTFISAQLIKDTWVQDPAARYLSDIASTHRPTAKVILQGRALVDGAADCFDVTFPKVPIASFDYMGVVFFQDSAVESSSRLIIFHNGGGWPVKPNGGNIVIAPSEGPDRLFRVGTYPA